MKVLLLVVGLNILSMLYRPVPSVEFEYLGYNSILLKQMDSTEPVVVKRLMLNSLLERYGLSKSDSVINIYWGYNQKQVIDTVPVSFGEMSYRYIISGKDGTIISDFKTDPYHFPENLIPSLKIPRKPGWEKIYQKAWDLSWQRIRTSAVLPCRYAYNDYPDNNFTYVWDAFFCNLFQRYAEVQGGHPGILTFDAFYQASQKYGDGYIPRRININNLLPHERERLPSQLGTNPPLYGWAEWNYLLQTGDSSRLSKVLPILCKNYDFIEKKMQIKPGCYEWGGDGSGWDNIDWKEEGKKLKYWVELPALQALAAKYIVIIAETLNENEIAKKFRLHFDEKKRQIDQYWNDKEGWYCGLTEDGEFTRKTLQGIWPLMAGLVDREKIVRIVDTLQDKNKFNTFPMPLPSLAKDELGYNPKGEYWLGSVWINMSLITIRALRQNGYPELALQFAERTLDGINAVYVHWNQKPNTLWECYSPELIAPASHKINSPDVLGTVRSDFGGWTGVLINLLIEEVFGIVVDAHEKTIIWNLRYNQDFELTNLKFGNITADFSVNTENRKRIAKIKSSETYTLILNGKQYLIVSNQINKIQL